MRCPYCGNGQTEVKETVRGDEYVLRQRQCASCRRRFMTTERQIEDKKQNPLSTDAVAHRGG